MKIFTKAIMRLDGRHLYVVLESDPNRGDRAEWLLSDEAARMLRDALIEALPPDEDPEVQG